MRPNSFRKIKIGVLNQWQFKTASCLRRAQDTGEIALDLDCDAFSSFLDWIGLDWMGWEGAVLRTKLKRSADPIDLFLSHYFQSIGISEANKIFK